MEPRASRPQLVVMARKLNQLRIPVAGSEPAPLEPVIDRIVALLSVNGQRPVAASYKTDESRCACAIHEMRVTVWSSHPQFRYICGSALKKRARAHQMPAPPN